MATFAVEGRRAFPSERVSACMSVTISVDCTVHSLEMVLLIAELLWGEKYTFVISCPGAADVCQLLTNSSKAKKPCNVPVNT